LYDFVCSHTILTNLQTLSVTSFSTSTLVVSTTLSAAPTSTNTLILQYTTTTSYISTITSTTTIPSPTSFQHCPGGEDATHVSPVDGKAYQMQCDVIFQPANQYISSSNVLRNFTQCVEYCSTINGCTAVSWFYVNIYGSYVCYTQDNQYTIQSYVGGLAANLTGNPATTVIVNSAYAGPTVSTSTYGGVTTAPYSISLYSMTASVIYLTFTSLDIYHDCPCSDTNLSDQSSSQRRLPK